MEKPTKKFISFYRMEGNYNLINSSELSAQYVITGIDPAIRAEKDFTISFLVDIEHDQEFDSEEITPLELLDELAYIYENKYFFNSRLKDIDPIKSYLESIEDEQEPLRHQYKVDYAKYQIDYWSKELIEALKLSQF